MAANFAIGIATVLLAALVRNAAALKLARRTGESYWTCIVTGWAGERFLGVPALSLFIMIFVFGAFAFLAVGVS